MRSRLPVPHSVRLTKPAPTIMSIDIDMLQPTSVMSFTPCLMISCARAIVTRPSVCPPMPSVVPSWTSSRTASAAVITFLSVFLLRVNAPSEMRRQNRQPFYQNGRRPRARAISP